MWNVPNTLKGKISFFSLTTLIYLGGSLKLSNITKKSWIHFAFLLTSVSPLMTLSPRRENMWWCIQWSTPVLLACRQFEINLHKSASVHATEASVPKMSPMLFSSAPKKTGARVILWQLAYQKYKKKLQWITKSRELLIFWGHRLKKSHVHIRVVLIFRSW